MIIHVLVVDHLELRRGHCRIRHLEAEAKPGRQRASFLHPHCGIPLRCLPISEFGLKFIVLAQDARSSVLQVLLKLVAVIFLLGSRFRRKGRVQTV